MRKAPDFKILLFVFSAGIFFILAAGMVLVYAGKQIENSEQAVYSFMPEYLIMENEQTAQEPTRAQQVMTALAQAYPQQIEKAQLRDGEWAVLLRDKWYVYAAGRIMPQEMADKASEYNSLSFYNYPAELPEWKAPTPEEEERFRAMADNRAAVPIKRSPYFLDDLWRANNRSEAYDRVKTMNFLGHRLTVHYMILEQLSLVEEQILASSRSDPQIQTWIRNISSIAGWSWRDIAETQSRSYHSYGLAIDILSRSYGGKEVYWLWASNHKPDWWNIPYSQRYHPPQAVIKAFETYGFIWGGKWTSFDTIHFEYRPEILILSGMPPKTQR